MMLLVLLAPLALADVVGGNRGDCPVGSFGIVSSRIGEYCAPYPARDIITCDDCRNVGLCLTDEGTCSPSDTDEDCSFWQEAHDRCQGQGDCDIGTCVVEDRCVREGPVTCSGCAVTAPGGAAALIGFVLLALASRRRPGRGPAHGRGLAGC